MKTAGVKYREEIRRHVCACMDGGVPLRCVRNVVLMGAVSESWIMSLITKRGPAGSGKCSYCGKFHEKLHNHHTNYLLDIVVRLCHKCHMGAHSKDGKFDHLMATPVKRSILRKWFPSKKNLKVEISTAGSIRLSKQNQHQITKAIEGTLVSANKAANQAVWLGIPALRKKLGKKGSVAE